MALVELGRVVRALGLKGHLGVKGSEGALTRVSRVTLAKPGEPGQEVAVREARRQGHLFALLVEGISNREAAETLLGATVLVERAVLGEAEPGSHFWSDLENLEVVTVTGEAVGRVTGLLETGGVDVLVVSGERGEALVPLAPYVSVDLSRRRILVDPPPGLL